MAVAFDARITGGNSADGSPYIAGSGEVVLSATSLSSTHLTLGGSATCLIAVLSLSNQAAVTPTNFAATWNGVSMTVGPSVTQINGSDSGTVIIFVLPNPATGNHTLAASWTSSQSAYLGAASFTGTDTVTGINAGDNNSATATTTLTVTSSSDGATVVIYSETGGVGNLTAMTQTMFFGADDFTQDSTASYALGGASNAHTVTSTNNSARVLVGVHILAGAGGGFTAVFRKTLSGIGSRVGTRQVHGN